MMMPVRRDGLMGIESCLQADSYMLFCKILRVHDDFF